MRRTGELKAFIGARDWVWDLLIDPGAVQPGGQRVGGSALMQLIQGCPVEVLRCIQEIHSTAGTFPDIAIGIEAPDREETLRAFCHDDVLRECVTEVLWNIQRHAAPATDGEKIPVKIVLRADEERVHVIVYNGGVRRLGVEEHGRGLIMCSERLRPYEGTIEVDEPGYLQWIFAVRLTLLRM
jgi:hypothetical protein